MDRAHDRTVGDIAIVTVGLDGRIAHWSRRSTRLLHVTAADVVGSPAGSLVPETERACFSTVLENLLRGRDDRTRIAGWTCAVAGPRPLLLSPIQDARGRVCGARLTVLPVAEPRPAIHPRATP